MRMHRALLLAAVFALSTLDGVAEEKQIVDVKELAGRWRGWVTEVAGDEWATMNVSAGTGCRCWVHRSMNTSRPCRPGGVVADVAD